jgi:hypothetical protein
MQTSHAKTNSRSVTSDVHHSHRNRSTQKITQVFYKHPIRGQSTTPAPNWAQSTRNSPVPIEGLSSPVHVSQQQGIKEISLVGESWTNKGYKFANEGYLIDKQGISWNNHRIFDPNRGYNQVRPLKI